MISTTPGSAIHSTNTPTTIYRHLENYTSIIRYGETTTTSSEVELHGATIYGSGVDVRLRDGDGRDYTRRSAEAAAVSSVESVRQRRGVLVAEESMVSLFYGW
jgi:hypothetical protein